VGIIAELEKETVPSFWELKLFACCHSRSTGAHQLQLLVAEIKIKSSSRGGQKIDIYRSNKYNIDYFYGLTSPNMFDDALKTKEKLNLDYFELFFSNKNLYICSQWSKWT
jgi:hypothetical protein